MNLEGIVLSEISQIEKTTTTNNGYVNLKKRLHSKKQSVKVVAGHEGGEGRRCWSKVQNFSYKIKISSGD